MNLSLIRWSYLKCEVMWILTRIDISFGEPSPGDIPEIRKLMDELGYPNPAEFFSNKLDSLAFSESDKVLVARVDDEVVGIAHLHIADMLHYPGKLGRVMSIVVSEEWRGRGAGGEMMKYLEAEAKERGCSLMEITSNIKREDTHRFYEDLGYEEKPKRFIKKLD